MQDVVVTSSTPMSSLDANCEKASINAINNTLKHLRSNQQEQLKAQCNMRTAKNKRKHISEV
jgi:hypothetical protein